MSDFYREVILDHYKNPRGHGAMESPDATAEGLNPLCGDEVSISVALHRAKGTPLPEEWAGLANELEIS